MLDLLEEGVNGTITSKTELFCREPGADAKDDKDFEEINGFRQDNKVVYQKAGIYFSLQAKTKTQAFSLGYWGSISDSDQRIVYNYEFKPKCKSVRIGTNGLLLDDGPDNSLNKRIYESTRGLTRYRYTAQFFGLGFWSRVYEIRDNM